MGRPVAVLAGLELTRCPRSLVGAAELEVMEMHGERYLQSLTPRQRRLAPARLVSALEYLADITAATAEVTDGH